MVDTLHARKVTSWSFKKKFIYVWATVLALVEDGITLFYFDFYA